MDLATFQPFLDWIIAHPTWAGLAVFVISLGESLVIVGLFIPGVAMMFGIGALVAMGALDLWATLAWAAAGAVAGDSISYWLGHHYKEHLREMWPFRRYPGLMTRGEQFFTKHGGKSVLFGRFVGPVRPIIPTIAGMLGMTPARFLTVNVLSAIAWAPAYTLPGVVFGASLGLASEIATRMTVMVLATLLILWLTAWLVYRLYLYLQPRGGAIIDRLMTWGSAHRYAGTVVTSVLDPQQSEIRGLGVLGAVLVISAVTLVGLGHKLLSQPLHSINTAVFNLLQGLRAPWADQLMVMLSELGSKTVLLTIALTTLAWLAWKRSWLAVLHGAGAVCFAIVLTIALGWGVRTPLGNGGSLWASGPVVMSTILYGLLAIMVTQGLRDARIWLPYAAAGLVVMAITLSQLYLGALWLTQAVSGWGLALSWVVVLGAAYRRHAAVPVMPISLTAIVMTALVTAMTAQMTFNFERDAARHAPRRVVTTLAMGEWWTADWQTLPAYRIDLKGRGIQPLTVQWAGPLPELSATLRAQGWQAPIALSGRNLLQWLRPEPPLAELPILPQVHDGRHESLRLVHPAADPRQLIVLRLWPSDYLLGAANAQAPAGDTKTALWVGNVSMVHAASPMPWLTVPITGNDFNTPLKLLQTTLAGLDRKTVRRPQPQDIIWDGALLLIRAKSTDGTAR